MGIRADRKIRQSEERMLKLKKEQDNKKVTILFKDLYSCCKSCECFKKFLIDDFNFVYKCTCSKSAYRPINFSIMNNDDGTEYFPYENTPVDVKLKCDNITFILLDL